MHLICPACGGRIPESESYHICSVCRTNYHLGERCPAHPNAQMEVKHPGGRRPAPVRPVIRPVPPIRPVPQVPHRLVQVLTWVLLGGIVLLAVGNVGRWRPAPPAAARTGPSESGPRAIPVSTPDSRPTSRPPSPTSTPIPTAPPITRLPVTAVKASASATPGTDFCGTRTTYEPTLVLDGQADTTWRVPGERDMWLQLDFPGEVRLHRVGIVPGYNKTDPCDRTDRFIQNRVIQEVKLEFSNGQSMKWTLAYDRRMQFVSTGAVRTRFVRLVILSSYPPRPPEGVPPRQYVAISEATVEGRME